MSGILLRLHILELKVTELQGPKGGGGLEESLGEDGTAARLRIVRSLDGGCLLTYGGWICMGDVLRNPRDKGGRSSELLRLKLQLQTPPQKVCKSRHTVWPWGSDCLEQTGQ